MCRAVQRQQVLALRLTVLAPPVEPARQVEAAARPLSAPAWEVLAAAALQPLAPAVAAMEPAFATTMKATTVPA